ncbi:hypothetical protein SI65_06122 [Aspergillus cristatus]|uniref:Transcription factor domain-containing protein n=1 Tax=Aspergillus cristatus TaxID=573508 RepID=A0A1E3BBU6_ASPCR|nr:hypothetical protein SI65_06122 [Aspergillus cristatus]
MSQESTPVGRIPSASDWVFPSYPSGSPGASSARTAMCTNLMTGHNAELLVLRARNGRLEDQNRKLEERIRELLSKQTPAPIQGLDLNLEMISSRLSGTLDISRESDSLSHCRGIIRGVMHKARFIGQSHWLMTGISLISDIFETINDHLRVSPSNPWSSLERCKSLARTIEAQRMSFTWGCYLRTPEAIYRILHVPTFFKNYEALWVSDTMANTAFLAQVKLVLAIGATTYDGDFKLRTSAVRWVQEAQFWSSKPEFKSQLNIQSLQTNLLLLLARERVGVDRVSIWISMGAFVPHREVHRRLWNTVLELALQSSLTSGGPPLISLQDYNTKPPRNFNDDKPLADDPVPSSADTFTQTSIARALRKTFAQRFAVDKCLNNLTFPETYKPTLSTKTYVQHTKR